MKKVIFSALLLLAANAIFAQKATKQANGSWVLDGVQMSQDDKTALLNLLRPHSGAYKILEVDGSGRTVATYGSANIRSVAIDNKAGGDANAKKGGTVLVHTKVFKSAVNETVLVHIPGVATATTSQVDAIMVKYSK